MLEARSDRSSTGRGEGLASRLVFRLDPRESSRDSSREIHMGEERGYWCRRGRKRFLLASNLSWMWGSRGIAFFKLLLVSIRDVHSGRS